MTRAVNVADNGTDDTTRCYSKSYLQMLPNRILLNHPDLFLWRFRSVVCSESKFNGTGAGVTADLTSLKLLILSVSCG